MRKSVFLVFLFCLTVISSAVVFADDFNCGGALPCSCGMFLNESRILNASDPIVQIPCDNSTYKALEVRGNNIALDCAGFTISGSNKDHGDMGISSFGNDNFNVTNCKIQSFRENIVVSDGKDFYIFNNTISDSFQDYPSNNNKPIANGITVRNVSNATILNNTIFNLTCLYCNSGDHSPMGIVLMHTDNITDSVVAGNDIHDLYSVDSSLPVGIHLGMNNFEAYTNNNLIENNTINNVTCSASQIGVCNFMGNYMNGSAPAIFNLYGNGYTIKNNNISNVNVGLFLAQRDNQIKNNNIENATYGMITSIYVTIPNEGLIILPAHNYTIENNKLNNVVIGILMINQTNNNIFKNNLINATDSAIVDNSESFNLLSYNDNLNIISWRLSNISIIGNINMKDKILSLYKLIGLDNIFENLNRNLNTTSSIIFSNLTYSTKPALFKDGVRCDTNASVCNITSYDAMNGILYANVTSFSNYTVKGQVCMYV